ncbi:MAG: Uma2 family endonuclease [Acidobacteriia bacterium]|nr:Uma2 family endonuclease [Terriglobia bacterium]
MASLPNAKTLTYDQWLKLPLTAGGREEVVNGEITFMPPNKWPHAQVVRNLVAAFLRQIDPAAVELVFSDFGLVIRRDPLTCREPDLALFDRGAMVVQDGYFHSPPQLAIAVLSPSETRRQIEEKLRDYESIGVPEVWLVSPEAGTLERLLPEGGRLRRSAIVAEGSLTPQRFPNVSIDILAIWPE